MSGTPRSPVALFAKAALDRCAAASGLLFAAPLIGAAALAIRLEGRGPVFFTQERPGLNGERFRVAKLRTMREATGSDGQPPLKFKAGEGFVVKAGLQHDARNTGAQPLKLAAIYVVDKGKPIATPVP